MTADRRAVRFTVSFLEDLEAQLPHQRGAHGAPSINDFKVHELLRVCDRLALDWDRLPELIAGRSDYRIVTVAGKLVPVFTVVAQLAADGAIELVELEVDLDAPWD